MVSSSARSAAISRSTGAIMRHGPHHSAQKSTSTGLSLPSTTSAKVASVTAVTPDIPAPHQLVGELALHLGQPRDHGVDLVDLPLVDGNRVRARVTGPVARPQALDERSG